MKLLSATSDGGACAISVLGSSSDGCVVSWVTSPVVGGEGRGITSRMFFIVKLASLFLIPFSLT